jgi:hypothetical protein
MTAYRRLIVSVTVMGFLVGTARGTAQLVDKKGSILEAVQKLRVPIGVLMWPFCSSDQLHNLLIYMRLNLYQKGHPSKITSELDLL